MKFKREDGLPYPQPWEYVLSLIGDKKNGVFIDVGAYDGDRVSNSIYFEDILEWSGVCIEPNPNAYTKLIKNRNCVCINAGVTDIESELPFYKVSGHAEMLSGFMSYISKEHIDRINIEISRHGGETELVNVKTVKLEDVIKDNNLTNIDYLSIDTEGNELNVLKSINFDNCRITYISAENNDRTEDVKEFLKSKGYDFLNNICGDDIYKLNR
jgi:FkbM family methyltransferase